MKIDNLNVEIPRNADILKIVKTNDRASNEESTTYSLLTYGTDINSKRAQTIMTTTDINTSRSVLDINFYGSDNSEKRVHVSDTPIRVGDMETSNLLIANRGDLIEKYFKSQSTSEEDRINLVNQILTADNPMQLNVSITGANSINRKILNNYLQVLEVELED